MDPYYSGYQDGKNGSTYCPDYNTDYDCQQYDYGYHQGLQDASNRQTLDDCYPPCVDYIPND